MLKEFFDTVKEVAELDKTEYSIKDLTILIARKAGYYRDIYTFKNGNKRERTMYKYPFDNILVAKWYMYYKKRFTFVLSKHHELEEYYSQIIFNTFYIFINCIDIEKLVNDKVVNKYFNMTLESRVSYALYFIGSSKKYEKYLETGVAKFSYNDVIDKMSLSIDQIVEDGFSLEDDYDYCNEDILNIKEKINSNIGNIIFESMLYSGKKIQLSHIDDFINLDGFPKNEETKNQILYYWNLIKKEICKYNNIEYKPDKKVMFSFEKR